LPLKIATLSRHEPLMVLTYASLFTPKNFQHFYEQRIERFNYFEIISRASISTTARDNNAHLGRCITRFAYALLLPFSIIKHRPQHLLLCITFSMARGANLLFHSFVYTLCVRNFIRRVHVVWRDGCEMNVLRVQHLWRIGILPISPSGRRAFPIHASLSPPSEITHNELGALTYVQWKCKQPTFVWSKNPRESHAIITVYYDYTIGFGCALNWRWFAEWRIVLLSESFLELRRVCS
jgi:hypothetical protein